MSVVLYSIKDSEKQFSKQDMEEDPEYYEAKEFFVNNYWILITAAMIPIVNTYLSVKYMYYLWISFKTEVSIRYTKWRIKRRLEKVQEQAEETKFKHSIRRRQLTDESAQ
jgi:hypothetical protein